MSFLPKRKTQKSLERLVLRRMAEVPKPKVNIELVLAAIENFDSLNSEEKTQLEHILKVNPKIRSDYERALELKGHM